MTARTVETARSYYQRGIDAYARGRAAGSLRIFARAARVLDGGALDTAEATSLRGRLWLSSAVCEAELHSVDASVSALDNAAAAAKLAGDQELAVLVNAQRGSILLRAGQVDAAATALDLAIAKVQVIEPRDRAVLFLNHSVVALYRGELRRAQLDLDRAIAAAAPPELAVQRLQATHNLAYVRFLLGDLPAALGGMDDAAAMIPDLNSGVILLDKSRVLVEAGLLREADDTLARAAAIFRADRLGQDLGETEVERARCALLGGDAVASRQLAMHARDRFRRRGADGWRRSAELVLLQSDLAVGRPGRRLTGPALRLRQQFERDGLRLSAQTAALIAVEAHLATAEPQAAAQLLAGLGRARRSDPITLRLHAQYVRARLDAAAGRPAAASRRARNALDELAAYQASFGSIDLATAAAVHGRRLSELDLSIALDSARPANVLIASERSRAVTNRLPAVRPPSDPELAELLAELRQTVESSRAVEQDRVASAPLAKRRYDLEAQIAARGWSRAGGGVVGNVIAIDDLQVAVGDATMVSYSQVRGALHAVVATGTDLRLVTFGAAAEIDEHVRRVRADLDVLALARLPGALRGAVGASLTRSLAALDAGLLAPLDVHGPLVVVTTGVLGQLPWGLLPSLRGVPVVVAPSATAWHAAHTRPASAHRGTVALAGPDLDRGEDEAATVARIWRGRLLSGGPATAAELVAAMAGARILHIAAHGVHQTENPLFSSLRLADGPLFAHELDQTARTPDHVVLSACELGLATVRPGDEALGLTSVLLHLGTRSVVAGVARVGDDLAAATMADYHHRLRGGAASAVALAGALETHRTAPFVCFGATFSPR